MDEQNVHDGIGGTNAVATQALTIPRKKRICLVGTACNNLALDHAARQFKVSVTSICKDKWETEKNREELEKYVEDTTYDTYFILEQFEGPEFDVLCKSAHRILGPTALLQLVEKKDPLPNIKRPLYTRAMVDTVVVFSGFRAKEDELRKLANMVLSMGGSIRKEMGIKVTHLIANHCIGEKYRYADTFGLPIMSVEWVTVLWKARDDISSRTNKSIERTYKLKPLYGAKVCFIGFPEEEKKHMCDILEKQGGEPTEIGDPNCTHVVVDVADPPYKKSGNMMNKLSYLKNPSSLNPFFLRHFQVSSSLYNPYPNSSFIPIQARTKYNIISNSESTDFIKTQNYYFSLENISFISQMLDADNSKWADLTPNNITHDSATHADMHDNCPDMQNSTIKSDNMLHHFVEQSDYSIDINKSFNLSDAFSASGKCSNSTSTICDKKIKFSISESSLFSSNHSLREFMLNFSSKSANLKFPKSFEKNNAHNMSIPPMNNNALFLKYRKNIHYIQNNTSTKRISTPKRYIKWRTNSCTSDHKTTTPEKYKFMKTRSYPNISKHCEKQYGDTFLQSASSGRKKYLSKSYTSIFSKTGHLSICSTFRTGNKQASKQDVFNDSYYPPPEKTMFKRKYTSLSKSFPIPTKISNIKHSSRNTFTPNGKRYNVTPASDDTKIDCTDLRAHDESLLGVIDESNINVLPNLGSASAYMVKTGWFWTSVQNEVAADEKDYLFEHYLETVMSPSASGRRDSQQIAGQNVGLPQHPLRLGVPLSDFLHSSYINGPDSPPSVSGSFLDCTASPDKQLMNEVEAGDIKKARGNLSKRHQVFRELVETESNYVGILNTIITLFKIPLENLIGMGEKELLNSTEVKTIFGNFLPIYNVHKQLLESLRYSDAHWTENISIGNIFLKFEKDLRKAYKPYLIFYKSTENELIKYDREKPRFHAFLKNCQTIPQCGRQTLKELLIKPVQRLPSIKLLFYEILKETDKSDPDFNALENSISCIEELLSDLNEAMKEAARQREVFFVYKYTENCPPDLVSSKRSFVAKCDVMELGWKESLSGRCDPLVLFLFTDTLVVCKKKSKAFNSLKSPNTMNDLQSSELSQEKFLYKYIKQLSLDTIRKVMDIRETDECHNAFALVVRSKQELKEKVFSFVITDEEVNKTNYLRTLCRQMAIPNKVADAGTLLISYDWHQFETGTSDNASGTFKKTIKFASRTRAKVSRAFSFNKTPSKLNRAMSTFMSPFGVAHDLAPTSQQRNQMRLGSCSNINELDNDGTSSPTRDDVIVAPMSDQPTRKALSMASLRRL